MGGYICLRRQEVSTKDRRIYRSNKSLVMRGNTADFNVVALPIINVADDWGGYIRKFERVSFQENRMAHSHGQKHQSTSAKSRCLFDFDSSVANKLCGICVNVMRPVKDGCAHLCFWRQASFSITHHRRNKPALQFQSPRCFPGSVSSVTNTCR